MIWTRFKGKWKSMLCWTWKRPEQDCEQKSNKLAASVKSWHADITVHMWCVSQYLDFFPSLRDLEEETSCCRDVGQSSLCVPHGALHHDLTGWKGFQLKNKEKKISDVIIALTLRQHCDFHVSVVCHHANVNGILVHLRMLCYPRVQEGQEVQGVRGGQQWSKLS